MKSYVVIGLGRFGLEMAAKLYACGEEVLAIDTDETVIDKIADRVTRAVAADENRTVLYVSHNMETVRALCDRCIVLSEGRIVYQGDTEDAIRQYRSYLMSENRQGRNVDEIIRRDKNLSGLCKAVEMEVRNNTLSDSEPLRFMLKLRAERRLSSVAVRLLVSNSLGQLIGMSSSEFFELPEGETTRFFELPTECLGAGEYVCDIVVFSFERNIQTRHDFLSKILSFRVNRNQLYFGSKWLSTKWGNILLPTMTTRGVENGKTE